jgi:hypothetical protein
MSALCARQKIFQILHCRPPTSSVRLLVVQLEMATRRAAATLGTDVARRRPRSHAALPRPELHLLSARDQRSCQLSRHFHSKFFQNVEVSSRNYASSLILRILLHHTQLHPAPADERSSFTATQTPPSTGVISLNHISRSAHLSANRPGARGSETLGEASGSEP